MKEINKNLIIYQAKDGAIALRQDFDNETFWAKQKQIAKFFDVERSVITRHINNIYKDKEVGKDSTCAKITQGYTIFNLERFDKNKMIGLILLLLK